MLYMTVSQYIEQWLRNGNTFPPPSQVLGFDSITISFCKAAGVTESLVSCLEGPSPRQVGLLVGVSSILGFLGSLAFPPLRARLGTPLTALIGSPA